MAMRHDADAVAVANRYRPARRQPDRSGSATGSRQPCRAASGPAHRGHIRMWGSSRRGFPRCHGSSRPGRLRQPAAPGPWCSSTRPTARSLAIRPRRRRLRSASNHPEPPASARMADRHRRRPARPPDPRQVPALRGPRHASQAGWDESQPAGTAAAVRFGPSRPRPPRTKARPGSDR